MSAPLAGRRAPIVTVDVEDWLQSSWDRSLPVTSRAADNAHRVLDVLAAADVRATMFVQGLFAEAFPEVVREIHGAGHEVASHGRGHVEIFKLSRIQFRDDVRRSKDVLEQIVGESVVGYRAPDFSIVRESLWALDVLAELDFQYDSSIFPIRGRRYGIADWPLTPAMVALRSGKSILELPIAALSLAGRNWPVGGGGYFRLLPGLISRCAARRVLAFRPFVFYCHPYEFDPREMWDLEHDIPLKVRLHQGLGRARFEKRFAKLLRALGGQSIRQWRQRSSVDEVVTLAEPAARRAA